MSASKIEWTDRTWNPTTGCTRVSPGCDRCYAIGQAHRFAHGASPLPLTERRGDRIDWTGEIALHDSRLDAPRRWRKPSHVFVDSMSDLFHDSVPDLFITRVFETMEQTPQHTYQVLTKRHGRMRSFVQARAEARRDYARQFDEHQIAERRTCPAAEFARRRAAAPPPNIWLGVSVEDQKRADLRISALLDTPAAVRFLSCEPLLGPVCLDPWHVDHSDEHAQCAGRPPHGLHWVIAGGESGPGARPLDVEWVRSLVEQCGHADVPVFVKQLGSAYGPNKGGDIETFPADLRVRDFPAVPR